MERSIIVPENHKHVLGLHLPTDPRWVELASIHIEDILSDHAYCEQKAATACISIIQNFPDKIEMVRALAPIVTEEWGHFRMVLEELEKRGLTLGPQRKDEYVNALKQFERKPEDRTERMIERLISMALIEARSCERFRLLSIYIADDDLKRFYYQFMVSEAGHYRLFIDLAKKYSDEAKVMKRWAEYLDYEAELMKRLEVRGDRIH